MPIDPFVAEVATGVVTTGVTSALAVGTRLFKHRIKLPGRRKAIDKDTQIKTLISRATMGVARTLTDGQNADELKRFLATAEVSAVIRQYYSWRISGGKLSSAKEIRHKFTILLQLY